MTPAIERLEHTKTPYQVHTYVHDSKAPSYGEEAVQKLGLDSQQVFKTLLAQSEKNELLVAIVPVSGLLDLKALAQVAGCKKCEMATAPAAQRATGYLVGGISPLGQKKEHRTFIDSSAQNFATIHVSAGKRGLEVELAPHDLAKLCNAEWAKISKT